MEITLAAGEFALFTDQKLEEVWLVSSIDEGQMEESTQTMVFPNPVGDELHIKASQQINAVQIYDINGRLILRSEEQSVNSVLNLSALQSGFYLMQIELADGGVEYHKLQK
ncbi:T9SS type A sorting domain-containing protein [Geofilum rubicundum]|uniref:Secretion system C-terminal sorting domain-containing protein n=1 Tax=Geofilum rubicundum JCM 15548 TaxID=1236989 RepID=A0A0E9LWJ8_9BACT|nr:T9SS type A sorting domain-containing protein [Geofilum rubicundum]GAO29491.1 hypothetical protein JCM15548_11680 [Geofilum rubicundum JCM 15548]